MTLLFTLTIVTFYQCVPTGFLPKRPVPGGYGLESRGGGGVDVRQAREGVIFICPGGDSFLPPGGKGGIKFFKIFKNND